MQAGAMSDGSVGATIAVKFTPVGRADIFQAPDGFPTALIPGDSVVVQTDGGSALGHVVALPRALAARRPASSSSPHKVVRLARREDVVTRLKQQQRELEAYRVGLMKIRERGLAMKLSRVEQGFDGARLVFHFTAEGRVDFRELVRELAAEFKTRIEMRQIGVRDEAKMLGGYGSCGRPLCCTTFLQSFEPISIKMAKQQDLALNPSKLSGLCGRLKCCLRYELPDGKGSRAAHAGSGDEGGRCGCGGDGGCGGGCSSGGCKSCPSLGSCGHTNKATKGPYAARPL
jgi:cell fate regulator YaaT (PSP1 superfamily)